jgi:hypothetical protein
MVKRAFDNNLPRKRPRVRYGAKTTAPDELETGKPALAGEADLAPNATKRGRSHAAQATPQDIGAQQPAPVAGAPEGDVKGREQPRSSTRPRSNGATPKASDNANAVLAAADSLVKQLVGAQAAMARLEADLRNARVELERAVSEARGGRSEARDLAEQRAKLLERLRNARRAAASAPANPPEVAEEPAVTHTAEPTLAAGDASLALGSERERAMLRTTLRDLSAGSKGLRLVALERLAGMESRLAAPVFAAALSYEFEPEVLAHLCRVAGRCGVSSLLPLLERHATHPDERVRVAVLFARRRLAEDGASNASASLGRPQAALPMPAPVQRSNAVLPPEDHTPHAHHLATDHAHEVAWRGSGNVRRQHPGLLGQRAHPSLAVRGGRMREIEHELRQNLRGLTPDALLETLSLSRPELNSALDAAISSGRIVRRGPRYFAS